MNKFMVVCTFSPNVVWDEVTAMVPEEMAAVKALEADGVLSGVRVSVARDKVFIEVSADDAAGAKATVQRLPMSKWWDLDPYQIAVPV
ncbi:MAG TPA: hypothetical protein VMV96_05990 [Acidimicrobiales bacterium]|nr:hypothetical protein [Acidimicrobiales bacterium]